MKNEFFNVSFNAQNGTICEISNPSDIHKMNWCNDKKEWGRVYHKNYMYLPSYSEDMSFVSFWEKETESESVYSNGKIQVTAYRFFDAEGRLCERYTVKNISKARAFFLHGDLSIAVPFNDCYTDAEDCMTNRCSAHIWCGYNSTYVNALRMGLSELNLGLVLTKGSIPTYSMNKCPGLENVTDYGEFDELTKGCRAEFIFDCDNFSIAPDEEYVFEWVMFWHEGKEDFEKKLCDFESFAKIDAEHQTAFLGEPISFEAYVADKSLPINVTLDGKPIDYTYENGKVKVEYYTEKTGEYRIFLHYGERKTYAEFQVKDNIETIIDRRLDFIVENQQYKNEGDPHDGAFLTYDNTEKVLWCDENIYDHNSCRERLGMALLLIRYLQTHENKKFKEALDRFIEFFKRELFIEEDGIVCNSIGKDNSVKRLYNQGWGMLICAEMYQLTKDEYYAESAVKICKYYYANGGNTFYPNGIRCYRIYKILKDNNHQGADVVLEMFKTHAQKIISIGNAYPKHEVNYEQTIVTPAVSIISEVGRIIGDEEYTKEASWHAKILERFHGKQPSFHLKEIPIRYWDSYWFGKSRMFADNFPHHWSALTANVYVAYYKISNDEYYLNLARECMRNTLCLFDDEGHGAENYVYPFRVDGKKGQFYDEWANDQDFILYFVLDMLEQVDFI